jgi:sugar/nucleoside kinase (ribokinase family)
MSTLPLLRYIIAGSLRRNYIITPKGKALLDVPGGSLLYASAGTAVWESGIGLIGRAGEDYPHDWLEAVNKRGMDLRGIHTLPEAVDLRYFAAYVEGAGVTTDNPVSHFARLGLPYPKSLLGYIPPGPMIDSKTRPTLMTIRQSDFPSDYLDVTAAHLCPLDFLSHTLLPSLLRQGHINTITLDPGLNYMNPTFWDDIPVLLNGLNAFLCSEEKITSLFQGRSTDLWEMAEALAGYGCEMIIIKRGSRGQYLYNGASHARWIIPAYPIEVVDPTGAGDAFCGGFLAGYRSTYDPLQAALTGNISAAMTIEGSYPYYALDALPGLARARLESLQETVRKV